MSVIVGHGIDIVEIERIRRMLDDHQDRFIDRCFTAVERDYAEQGRTLRVERYAARFAAKEAILKALGTGLAGGASWLDMTIATHPSGQPQVVVTGRCSDQAAALGINQWHISLSHTATLAMASVIACRSAIVP